MMASRPPEQEMALDGSVYCVCANCTAPDWRLTVFPAVRCRAPLVGPTGRCRRPVAWSGLLGVPRRWVHAMRRHAAPPITHTDLVNGKRIHRRPGRTWKDIRQVGTPLTRRDEAEIPCSLRLPRSTKTRWTAASQTAIAAEANPQASAATGSAAGAAARQAAAKVCGPTAVTPSRSISMERQCLCPPPH